jgi:hypothetical protein
MTGGRTGVAVHRAYDECGTWLAANIGHPACRQKRAQNHRGKREMNCQVTQIAGHISSGGTLMIELACRQDGNLAQLAGRRQIVTILASPPQAHEAGVGEDVAWRQRRVSALGQKRPFT